MQTATFRIQGLRVEGFKAFAASQDIEIGNGHLFVFGKNGHGKSSVVEAIRWCLFGLADRPEAEVRNVFYSEGECKVELDLLGPGGKWTMQRRLRPGSGRSDLIIHNPEGTIIPQSKVFPHIARLGPREGTHIIFASQQATNRRPQADISDFDKVLYSYLRVEEIPQLLTRLDRTLEEQTESERRVAKEVADVEDELRGKLKEVLDRIDEMLKDPPWPDGTVPTNAETDARIRRFVEECSGSLTRADGGPVDREWLLAEAERTINSSRTTAQVDLRRDLNKVQNQLQTLTNARDASLACHRQLAQTMQRVSACEAQMAETIGDASKKQLETDRDELNYRLAQLSKSLSLTQQAYEYYQQFAPSDCPVCAAPKAAEEVLARLKAQLDSDAGAKELADHLSEIIAKLAVIEISQATLDGAKSEAATTKLKADSALALLLPLLDDSEDEESCQRTADRINLRIAEIQAELTSAGSLITAKAQQLKKLQHEARFQTYRRREESLLRDLDTGLTPTREAHREFLDLLDTLGAVRDTLQDAFNSGLDTTLPKVGELMTMIYGRLTQQASFTRIVVTSGPLTNVRWLRVKVSSERTPGEFFEPSEVLNGQAFSALNLVPYFVFSQFQADALELDCLLIDDPSQSFDTSRIELLLHELGQAASHAQLIVASHEEDRFEPFLHKYFAADSYRVVRVKSFTPEAGPVLERTR